MNNSLMAFCTTALLQVFYLAIIVSPRQWAFGDILIQSSNEYETAVINSIGRSLDDDLCDTLRCRKGEECVVVGRIAQCQCKQKCPELKNPICASDGKTYQSHCHFYVSQCNAKIKRKIINAGSCADRSTKENLQLSLSNQLSIQSIQTNYHLKTGNVSTTLDESRSETNNVTTVRTPATTNVAPATTTIEQQAHCDHDDFVFIPSNLLLYFHAKYAENSRGEVEHGKSYLVHLMLSNFDVDGDKVLTRAELEFAEKDERYTKLMPPGCHLRHLIQYGDLDGNGELSTKEFYGIFGLSVSYLPHNKEIKHYYVEIGKQYQLYCDIDVQNNQNARITWYRYDVPLVNVVPYNFEVSADGSLYLTPASLIHSGNFTCRVGAYPSLEQKHIVYAQERPVVEIEPEFLLLKSGESGKLRCKVKKGYPVPKIIWEKNSVKILENVTTLELINLNPQDTGSYKCVAINSLASDHATASVVIRDEYQQPEVYLRKAEKEKLPRIVIMYDGGINMYNAYDCSLAKSVLNVNQNSTDDRKKILCQDGDRKKCHWSDAVITQPGNFIYAALSEQRLLVKVNTSSGIVDEIFRLNHIPMRLWYVSWEDSVWIESWHDRGGFFRTVQVIRSASKSMIHAMTHALPIHEEYDSVIPYISKVENLFLPSSGDLNYGYVTHWQELALHKFDLKTLKVVSRLSLAPYDCHPSDAEFIAQSGLVVINCVKRNGTLNAGQLLIDYMSDSVLNYDAGIHGRPLASSDGQLLLTVDSSLGRLFVQKIIEKELHFLQTIDEFLPLTDWVLYPSLKSNLWLLYATSAFSNQLIKINVTDGKIEKKPNVGRSVVSPLKKQGLMITAPADNHYLLVSSQDGLSVVDLYNPDSVVCRMNEIINGTKIIVAF